MSGKIALHQIERSMGKTDPLENHDDDINTDADLSWVDGLYGGDMTDKHADRANGDTFFTVNELRYIESCLIVSQIKTRYDDDKKEIENLLKKCQKEKTYIEATNCKTIDC